MKRAVPLLALLLGSSTLAQMETRILPDPLVVLGVTQDTAGGSGLIALRNRYSTHLRLVDAGTGELKRELWLPADVIHNLSPALSRDGKWMALMLTPDPQSGWARVGIVNLTSSGKPDQPSGPTKILASPGLKGTTALALNADGSRLAAGNSNGYVQLWDTREAKRLTTINSDTKLAPSALHFTPDGQLLAPMFRGQVKTRLFNTLDGTLRNTLAGVGVGQFGPDNASFLASRGRVIDLQSGKEKPAENAAFLKGAGSIIGFSMDGTRVLVKRASTDAQGREWLELREVASGRTLGAVTRISDGYPEFLSPDGTSLIGGDGQGGVRILPIAPR
ncbi:WD40 repeat domain-containing protein [Deinococcus cavernae]|uniref:WD40 repeat domain-containing protein n=1 Tax=Deinococcus cavernae TaxID=2320857 RepID=A0A418V6X0_9DEIO|nr:WD40 repeat domain-containing protein [Deinococcus cavernae]RJF71863.1 WD40 repeat domain-containing protein [Deinococcus cavernae]